MALLKPIAYDGQLQRQVNVGDAVGGAEVTNLLGNSLALTVTGAMLASALISGNPTAAATYTLDSAANILAALSGGIGNVGIQPGTTVRVRHINTTAFAVTWAVTANTGMTVSNVTTNASSVKDFLMTFVNGSPAQVVAGTTVNASAVVSGFTPAQLANVTVGMIVTNAVANLQGQTVIAVNAQTGQLTFSGNANATNATPVAINLSPVITFAGIGQGLL